MNCESVLGKLDALANGTVSSIERRRIEEHTAVCEECRSAMRGAQAMRVVADQPGGRASHRRFERVMKNAVEAALPARTGNRFWLGVGVGGSIAAAIAIAALALGLIGDRPDAASDVAEFMVSMEETRDMDVAIELERALPGAILSVYLSGGIGLAGFADRRELVWTTDLEAGINKLTLPLFATAPEGGQVIVKLDHATSHQVFVVNLKLDT
jgi:hypothetical protein